MSNIDTVSKYGTDGLETVAEAYFTELVTRSQAESEIRKVRQDAEELLAEANRRNAELEREVSGLRNSYFEEKKARIVDNAAKDARIAELEAKLETANALVTCCCGSLVNDHDIGSGHSPVDQYHYEMDQLKADNKRLREALERMVSEYDEVSNAE